MNTPNRRPMPYRKRRGRRQTLRAVLITLACVVTVLLAAFMIIGNRLLKAIDAPSESETEQGKQETDLPKALAKAQQIGGYPIVAETSDSSTFSSRLSVLTAEGASAVSMSLNTLENVLLYRSPIAVKLGLVSASDRTVTLEQVMRSAEQAGVYVSGVYTLTAFGEEDDLVRSVALSHAAAILTEAFRAGIDDVLLIVPDWQGERAEELIRFAEGIRALQPDAVLGVAFNEAVLAMEGASELLETMSAAMNYLAMDATHAQGDDLAAAVDGLIHDPRYHYNLLYYEMRLLLPDGADKTERAALIAKTEESGIRNWQIVSAR